MADDKQHYLGHRKRLRERFIKSGLDGLADYEVIELLLTLAIPRSDVKRPAKALIARFRNLRGVLDARLEELREVPGIGSVTPVGPYRPHR
jgi:DNA repair protein RadC